MNSKFARFGVPLTAFAAFALAGCGDNTPPVPAATATPHCTAEQVDAGACPERLNDDGTPK